MRRKIPSNVTCNFVREEVEVLLAAIKASKTQGEVPLRARKRVIMKLLRMGTHRFPLYPNKECPICERDFSHKIFDRHVYMCKRKNKERDKMLAVDPAIIEMMEAGL